MEFVLVEKPKIVYAIKYNKTGRIYVGSSERASWRVKDHLNKLMKKPKELTKGTIAE